MPEKLPVLSDATIAERLPRELPGWTLENGWLRRKYSTDGWPTTLMLLNAIAFVSEAAWHHRARFRAGPRDREGGPVAATGRLESRGHAEQVGDGEDVLRGAATDREGYSAAGRSSVPRWVIRNDSSIERSASPIASNLIPIPVALP